MNEIDIRKYAGLMEELGLTGLEITEDDKVVRMERTSQGTMQSVLTAEQVQQLLAATFVHQGTLQAQQGLATTQVQLGAAQGMLNGQVPVLAGGQTQQVMSATSVNGNANANIGGDYITVKSPIVGVFYAAPAENASPFVALGDRIEKGKTLCIIEAMKLMNEIYAEQSGEIVEICVTNGQVVEYGTELFRIRR